MALLRLGTDGRLMLNGQTVVPEKKLIKKTIVILADTSGSVAGQSWIRLRVVLLIFLLRYLHKGMMCKS